MYRLQNVFGALKALLEVVIIFLEGTYEGEMVDMQEGMKVMRGKLVQFLKCILDLFVANYYLHMPKGQAARIGVVGTITSLIALCQALKVI